MNKYKNIIWDLDGTLLDTLYDLYLATNYALRTHGLPERTYEEIRQFVGNGVRRLMVLSVPNGEANTDFENIFATFKAYYVDHCRDNTGLYPGIAETLKRLKTSGYRMAIVSNKLQAGVTELYETFFKDFIDVAIGERPNIKRKPAPDMVYLAMKELGATKDDSVYIGDSEVDVATGHGAGLPCISVLWGFRTKEELLANGATYFVNTPAELLEEL